MVVRFSRFRLPFMPQSYHWPFLQANNFHHFVFLRPAKSLASNAGGNPAGAGEHRLGYDQT